MSEHGDDEHRNDDQRPQGDPPGNPPEQLPENYENPPLPTHFAATVKRTSVLNRLNRWIEFMASPLVGAMDSYAAETRAERGRILMRQMEELQLEVVSTAGRNLDVVQEFGNEFMELEDRYYGALSALNRRIGQLTAQNQPAAPAANANPLDQLQRIRLEMPPQQTNIQNTWGHFDGTLLKWKEFKERFNAAVHSNEHIDPVYKFAFLKKSLSGRPTSCQRSELCGRLETLERRLRSPIPAGSRIFGPISHVESGQHASHR